MGNDTKRLGMLRFEVDRAKKMAHHLSLGEMSDTHQAIRDLAQSIAALARAVDDLLERQEEELAARV